MIPLNKDLLKTTNFWQYQEAKAKLSEVMNHVKEEGYQVIVRNKKEIFIILSQEKFEEITQPKESLLDFFKRAPLPELDLKIKRNKDTPRIIDL